MRDKLDIVPDGPLNEVAMFNAFIPGSVVNEANLSTASQAVLEVPKAAG